MRNLRNIVVLCLVVLVAGGVWLIAQDNKPPAGAPAPSPEQKAMMDAWMKLGTPGAQHEKLKMMAGKFDAEVTMQMDPAAPAEVSKGSESSEMLYGGRYLKCDFVGSFMGQPFSGTSLFAYDNQKQKYVMTWIDSMSTMVMVAEGMADASGNVITLNSECEDPVTQKKTPMRQVLTIQDADHHTYESYQTKDGKENRCVMIKYTRAG
jgi:hypothetical protein